VSGFSFLERLALTENALGRFGVWIRPPAVAAVSSVKRLRMSANANFIAHVTLARRCIRARIQRNKVFLLDNLIKTLLHIFLPKRRFELLVHKGQFYNAPHPIDSSAPKLDSEDYCVSTDSEPRRNLTGRPDWRRGGRSDANDANNVAEHC
jgi:hypothetical protein